MKVDPTCHVRKEAIWLVFRQNIRNVGLVECKLPIKGLQEPTDVFLLWTEEELGNCKGRKFKLDYIEQDPLPNHLHVFVWFDEASYEVKGNLCLKQFIEIYIADHSNFVTIPSSYMYGMLNDVGGLKFSNIFF